MGGPHLWGLRDALFEDAMLGAPRGGHSRRHSVGLVREDAATVLEDASLQCEQVGDGFTLCEAAGGDADSLIPGSVGGTELVQRVDEGIAAGERDGDEIGLSLHLVRQDVLSADDEHEHGIEHRAQ